jgi:hypothetical protein
VGVIDRDPSGSERDAQLLGDGRDDRALRHALLRHALLGRVGGVRGGG